MSSRRLVALLATLSLAAMLTAAPAQSASTTVTACVNARTGAFKVMLGAKAKKKCAKGYRKVRWAAAGKDGATGPAGTNGAPGTQGPVHPALTVTDATGAVVGQFVFLLPSGQGSQYVVLRNGGAFVYSELGVLNANASPRFKTNTCAGTAYLTASTGSLPLVLSLAGSTTREVYRPMTPAPGPARAWKITATAEAFAAQLYRLDDSGVCVADGAPYATNLVTLDPVAAPPDFTGLLKIS